MSEVVHVLLLERLFGGELLQKSINARESTGSETLNEFVMPLL